MQVRAKIDSEETESFLKEAGGTLPSMITFGTGPFFAIS